MSTGSRGNLPPAQLPNWQFIRGDVNRAEDVGGLFRSYQFDYVFHYAAVVGVQRTLQNPRSVLRDAQALEHLLPLALNHGVRRVFFASSSEVYGESVEFPQREDTTPLRAHLPYAAVKRQGEAFLRRFCQDRSLQYTVFRFFNTYGPHQSEDFVISRFLRQACQGQPITIYGDGSQSRTFCHVDDNVEATVQILEQDLFVNSIVNIGNDREFSIRDLARLVQEETGSPSEMWFLPALETGDMPDDVLALAACGVF